MMVELLYKITPTPIWNIGRDIYHSYLKKKYLNGGRPFNPAETSKAKGRREKEKFFDLFCKGKGIDIGYGGDPIVQDVDVWDFEHGDAQYLSGVENNKYDFVYSSHTLEHLIDPGIALKNWWRILKRNGFLILYIPHRDLYEKKKKLPSRFNPNHFHFFMIDEEELPDTIGLLPLIKRTISDYEIVYIKECKEGNTITDPNLHSDGEYSIEAVIKKIA
ncbi:MAG: class I SAM-dependent methyltransferase [Ignavibacteriales bacterium]|nr:class I SAM-dependent methyltransferase [Ignavibacteriales bacterium]